LFLLGTDYDHSFQEHFKEYPKTLTRVIYIHQIDLFKYNLSVLFSGIQFPHTLDSYTEFIRSQLMECIRTTLTIRRIYEFNHIVHLVAMVRRVLLDQLENINKSLND